jgi:hypothetical protein
MSEKGRAARKQPSAEEDELGNPRKRVKRELENLSFMSPGVKTAIAGPIRETIARQTRRCTYKVVLDEEDIEHHDVFTEMEGPREDRALHLAEQLEASLTGFVDDVYGEEGEGEGEEEGEEEGEDEGREEEGKRSRNQQVIDAVQSFKQQIKDEKNSTRTCVAFLGHNGDGKSFFINTALQVCWV